METINIDGNTDIKRKFAFRRSEIYGQGFREFTTVELNSKFLTYIFMNLMYF